MANESLVSQLLGELDDNEGLRSDLAAALSSSGATMGGKATKAEANYRRRQDERDTRGGTRTNNRTSDRPSDRTTAKFSSLARTSTDSMDEASDPSSIDPSARCGDCEHFTNGICEEVAGTINADYVCDLYDAPDNNEEKDE